MATLHLHWSGEGDYLLPHLDVKQKDTVVTVSVIFGATLFMWEHDGSMKSRHAAEEKAIFDMVDTGSVLDDLMDNASFGNKHIHRHFTKVHAGDGRKTTRKNWSSAYLQAGDVLMLSSGYQMLHAAMKSSMQPCTAALLQYQQNMSPAK